MKKLDRIIMYSLATLSLLFIIYFMFTGFKFISTILGTIVLAGYILFLIFHLALFAPTIGVGILASALYEKTFNIIKDKSVILAVVSRAFFVIACVLFIHIFWVWVGSALFLQEVEFITCFKWFITTIEQ